jgi:hypothetical protein
MWSLALSMVPHHHHGLSAIPCPAEDVIACDHTDPHDYDGNENNDCTQHVPTFISISRIISFDSSHQLVQFILHDDVATSIQLLSMKPLMDIEKYEFGDRIIPKLPQHIISVSPLRGSPVIC